jgi:protein-disulfide isomerase
MKSTLMALAMLFCLVANSNAASFVPVSDEPKDKKENELTPEQIARLEAMKARVDEIKAMDKSALTKAERKALKKELKDMKKEAKAIRGGVYLSVGAIIIIILLLILLL